MLASLEEEIKIVCQIVSSSPSFSTKNVIALGGNENFPHRHAMFYKNLIEPCRKDVKFIHFENRLDIRNFKKIADLLSKLRNNEAYVYLDADWQLSKKVLNALKAKHIDWIIGTRTSLASLNITNIYRSVSINLYTYKKYLNTYIYIFIYKTFFLY